MNNKVVSYKTAMALKAKGFNEPTEFCYCGRETSLHMIALHLTNESLGEGKCSAPTMDEVRNWLFNKHKILIEIPLKVAQPETYNGITCVEYYYSYSYFMQRSMEFIRSATHFVGWDTALTAAINFIVEKEI